MRLVIMVSFIGCVSWGLCSGFISTLPDTPVMLAPTEWLGSAGFRGRSVTRDNQGWVYVAIVQGSTHRVRCMRSTNNGRAWVTMADVSSEDALYPNIGVARGDTLHVIWTRPMLDTLGMDIFWTLYDGTSWSPPLNISNQHRQQNDGMFCSMAMDTLGHPHVVWQNGGVWYSYYDGAAWSSPELVTSTAWYLSLCSDKRNRLHLAYRGGFYYRSRENGIWGPEEQVVLLADYPSIAVDTLFRPQACWAGVSDSGGDIFYNYRDSVSGWSAPVRLSYTRGASRYPSLSEDRWGHHYVVWCDWPDNRDSLTMLYYGNLWWGRYDGVQWQVDSLRYDTLNMDWEPSVGFPVSDSGVDVVWTQGPRSGPYRVMYWRLPLVVNGVEGKKFTPSPLSHLPFSVVPNPFSSFASVPGHSSERFTLFDISGRRVGVYKGDRIGLGLSAGVYFLKPEGQEGKPLRIVKLR